MAIDVKNHAVLRLRQREDGRADSVQRQSDEDPATGKGVDANGFDLRLVVLSVRTETGT